MLLTCPTCRSGLQVPDGTTAHVRCPTRRTVFSPAEGTAPRPPAPPPLPKPAPPRPPTARPVPPRARPIDDDEDDDRPRPRRRRRDDDDDEEEKDDRRDGIGDADDRPRKKRRRRVEDDGQLSPEEKQRKREAFARGMWGIRLIQISLLFYIPAVLLVPVHIIIIEITHEPAPGLLVVAGVLGILNWVTSAAGLGLCLSGPIAPGFLRFGVAAAVVIVVHAVLVLALVLNTKEHADFRELTRPAAQWGALATQYDSLSFYLAYVAYPDNIPLRRSDTALSFITGVVEMTRLILILMTLSGLALGGGDRALSDKCTRMAGRVSLIPGMLAVAMLVYKVFLIETGAEHQRGIVFGVLAYTLRAINVVVGFILGMVMRTVVDVAEVCEFPFQGEIDLDGSGATAGADF